MTLEERAALVFGEYRERQDRGEAEAPEALLRAHPDLAAHLRRKLAVLRRFDAAHLLDRSRADDHGADDAGRLVGTSLGPYRLVSLLGTGGMGSVLLADHGGARVAVKVLHPHLLHRRGAVERFRREAEIGRTIRHENVVATLDAGAAQVDGRDVHFLVMEYVEGRTLRSLLDELGCLPEELCRHVGREAASALAAIHGAGAVHRDVKPDNVLITRDHVVKLMDLGVARMKDEAMRLSQTGSFVGSVRYAAPEQFKGGSASVDGRADLYALGLTLYELSTGVHPFASDVFHAVLHRQLTEVPRPAGAVNPQLSAFFEELLRRLLEKDRAARLASAAELLSVLDEGERSAWWQDRARAIREDTRRPLRRIRIPRETALYGRDADLALLRTAFDRAKSGDGRVVLVEGEAGIGKSRLVDEFVGLLEREGEDLNFVFGGSPPGGAAVAWGAFATGFREQFGDEGLETTLARYLTPTPSLVPAFAALLRGEAPPAGEEPLSKDSLQTVFVHATRALAAERPTIVMIDDLHFASEEGRALFSSLALAVPGHRVLLVGTARPGLPEQWTGALTRHGHVSRIALARLGPKDLARLLVDAFRSERLAEELAFKIGAKSDGNPYFVFEILRGLRDGQFIKQQPDGTWVTTQVIAEIDVPSTVKDLIFGRISNLPTTERNLLDVAACAGFEFDPRVVGEAAGLARIPALQRLAGIERSHRLVRSAGRRFVFDHHQVAEVLYASLPEALREEYHAAIAGALETASGAAAKEPKDINGAVCVELVDHFQKGGCGTRALRYLHRALDHLERAYSNEEGVRLATQALAEPGLLEGRERADLLFRVFDWYELLGRRAAEREAADEIMTVVAPLGDAVLTVRAQQALAGVLSRTSRSLESESLTTATLALAREHGDRVGEARAIVHLGFLAHGFGRLDEANARYLTMLELARELGDLGLEMLAEENLGAIAQPLARWDDVRPHQQRFLALARQTGSRRGEAAAMRALGGIAAKTGHFDDALAHHERSLALAREIGDRRGEAAAAGHIAVTHQRVGRFDHAGAYSELHLRLSREIGNRHEEARCEGHLGALSDCRGMYAAALDHHNRYLAIARGLGDRRSEVIALVNLGAIRGMLGRLDEGRALLERGLELARQIGYRQYWGYFSVALADVASSAGCIAEAESRARSAVAECAELRGAELAGVSRVALGRALADSGRMDEARAVFAEALAMAVQIQSPETQVVALAHLAQLPGGDIDAALVAFTRLEGRIAVAARMDSRLALFRATRDPAHLAEAKRLLDFMVAHAPADCRESMLANVRLHREITAAAQEHGL